MSAFAVLFDRTGTPLEAGALERVMPRLDQRGPDGRDEFSTASLAMGHWHFWTTPEEQGERQPLALPGMPFRIVLDGRLDNRDELFVQLGIPAGQGRSLSDAALILHAYARWGDACFEHFLGEFAVVIHDGNRSALVCARDPLGDRTLFFAQAGACFCIASEPWALAQTQGDALNELAGIGYLALRDLPDGQTLFQGVSELRQAQVMTVDASGLSSRTYWQPAISRRQGITEAEAAAEFLGLLEKSVRCRLRGSTLPGVLMSGGLDSTSVACLAARLLQPAQLTTISYVFDELAECDERQYINAVRDRWDLRSIQIPCDDAWPFRDRGQVQADLNQPEGSPYHLLTERAFQCTHREGLRILLTGDFGDILYSAAPDWLAELLAEARFLRAGRELAQSIRFYGWRGTRQRGFLQQAGRRFIDQFPGGKKVHRRHSLPDWLTPAAVRMLTSVESGLPPRPNPLGARSAHSSSMGVSKASRFGLEMRHPYRDRRLVEFALSLPAYMLYSNGLYKQVLRNAMHGILPELVRSRARATQKLPLYARGVEREQAFLQNFFSQGGSSWSKYIDADWVRRRWNVPIQPGQDGPHALVPWLCVSFELWYKYHIDNISTNL